MQDPDTVRPEDAQADWAEHIVAGLIDARVTHFVVSPGSRSTPLVLALQNAALQNAALEKSARRALQIDESIDERSAAFFALGRVRATGEASALVCTSGTAGAHYLPAMMEAAAMGLPLIALTADRPPELQECGANQTVDQHGLFAPHARTIELGAANGTKRGLRAARRRTQQAAAQALAIPGGPVHLNAKFRKPLEPSEGRTPTPIGTATQIYTPVAQPAPEAIEAIVTACEGRGLIALGPDSRAGASRAAKIKELGARLGYPIIADVTSQVACAKTFSLEDAALRSPRFEQDADGNARADAPEVVLQFGRAPISKGFELFCERNEGLRRVVIDPLGFPDPHGTAALLVQANIDHVLDALLARVPIERREDALSRRVATLEARAEELRSLASPAAALNEPNVARAVMSALTPRDQLVVGNSLVARHLDRWSGAGSEHRVISQRGVSGIDGLIAGATGAASAIDQGGATFLLLGDVSFLHDLASLALTRACRSPLVIVVINNDGGRIFEELPIAKRGDLSESVLTRFTTPHGMTLQKAAELFSASYAQPASVDALRRALRDARERGCSVIEAVVPPSEARELFASLCSHVGAAL